jgi:hypothetical protein
MLLTFVKANSTVSFLESDDGVNGILVDSIEPPIRNFRTVIMKQGENPGLVTVKEKIQSNL